MHKLCRVALVLGPHLRTVTEKPPDPRLHQLRAAYSNGRLLLAPNHRLLQDEPEYLSTAFTKRDSAQAIVIGNSRSGMRSVEAKRGVDWRPHRSSSGVGSSLPTWTLCAVVCAAYQEAAMMQVDLHAELTGHTGNPSTCRYIFEASGRW